VSPAMDTPSVPGARIVMLCDWLPPDFGAVGQYAMTFARDLAGEGHDVALVGFSSHSGSCVEEEVGAGRLASSPHLRPHQPLGACVVDLGFEPGAAVGR
jgi:hypothetical protein